MYTLCAGCAVESAPKNNVGCSLGQSSSCVDFSADNGYGACVTKCPFQKDTLFLQLSSRQIPVRRRYTLDLRRQLMFVGRIFYIHPPHHFRAPKSACMPSLVAVLTTSVLS